MARVSREQLERAIAMLNKDLKADLTLGYANGGLRVESRRQSMDVSPRLSPKELSI